MDDSDVWHQVRSYSGTKSTGSVEIQGLKEGALKDLDVVLVEDIIDTGTIEGDSKAINW